MAGKYSMIEKIVRGIIDMEENPISYTKFREQPQFTKMSAKGLSQRRKVDAKHEHQPTNDLVDEYHEKQQSFDAIAIDYAGPFYVKPSRSYSDKAWIFLAFDYVTEGVYFDLVFANETQSFLDAFTRLCATRGKPSQVTSDTAPKFYNAARRLHYQTNRSPPPEVTRGIRAMMKENDEGIVWILAPAYGRAEKAIQTCKKILNKNMGIVEVDTMRFLTNLKAAEMCFNNRSLLKDNDNGETNFTPAYALIGRLFFAPASTQRPKISSVVKRNDVKDSQELLEKLRKEFVQERLKKSLYRRKNAKKPSIIRPSTSAVKSTTLQSTKAPVTNSRPSTSYDTSKRNLRSTMKNDANSRASALIVDSRSRPSTSAGNKKKKQKDAPKRNLSISSSRSCESDMRLRREKFKLQSTPRRSPRIGN